MVSIIDSERNDRCGAGGQGGPAALLAPGVRAEAAARADAELESEGRFRGALLHG